MSLLATVARATGLNRVPHVKQAVKDAYYALQDPLRRGVALAIGGKSIRVPARFARPPWTNYEPGATRRVAAWFEAHPDGALIDVGSSVALYSLLALASSARSEAWAIDSDRVSLQCSRRLCRHVGPSRLHVIHGYAGATPTVDLDAVVVAAGTAARLDADRITAEPACARYECLDTQRANRIPVHSLDRLFAAAEASRPWLIKIDIEGAELLVLEGADALVRRVRPQLMVSVHRPALRGYGHAPGDVAAWLHGHNYQSEVDVEPHEEHWWCTPAPADEFPNRPTPEAAPLSPPHSP